MFENHQSKSHYLEFNYPYSLHLYCFYLSICLKMLCLNISQTFLFLLARNASSSSVSLLGSSAFGLKLLIVPFLIRYLWFFLYLDFICFNFFLNCNNLVFSFHMIKLLLLKFHYFEQLKISCFETISSKYFFQLIY